MSKKKDDLVREDEVKEKFRDFLEALKVLNMSTNQDRFKIILNRLFPDNINEEYENELVAVDRMLNKRFPNQFKRTKSLPEVLSKLSKDDLRALSTTIAVAIHNVDRNDPFSIGGSLKRPNADIVSAMIIDELSNRI